MIEKIISGGQTGVDRASLDTAILLGIPHGGWCPKGRLAEDGKINEKYNLTETNSSDHNRRTELNIRDSDGTLILIPGTTVKITDGTVLTLQIVQEKKKPCLVVDLSENPDIHAVTTWASENHIVVLNIAGPRESQSPGIYQQSLKFLRKAMTVLSTLS